jgi:phosphatidate cytidylyltransferase
VSELAKRTLSGIVLIIVALGALLLGGWVFELLCVLVGLGVIAEWFGLARRFAGRTLILWMLLALFYVGLAVASLMVMRATGLGRTVVLFAAVWAVDIGAYFAGRTFGGPKLAPRLSPNKTWAGLIGGAIAATIVLFAFALKHHTGIGGLVPSIGKGVVIAVVAQAGDLFESWMKRRAGAKDSGRLIPGHGGLFDRVDGLLAVAFVNGVMMFGRSVL